MTKFIVACICAIFQMLCTSHTFAVERSSIYGIAPALSEPNADAVAKIAFRHILEADPGEHIQFFNALNQQRLCSIVIPQTRTKEARIQKLAAEILTLTEFFKSAKAADARMRNQIHGPRFFQSVATALQDSEGSTRVLVFGSLFHRDERDTDACFKAGEYLSDGHILAADESVFGTAGRTDSLRNVYVYWCHLGETMADLEERAVARFWQIYLGELGAGLTYCGPSSEVALDRAKANVQEPVFSYSINRADMVRERRVVGRSGSATEQPAEAPTTNPIAEQVQVAVSELPAPRAGFVNVSVVWTSADGKCDLDMWVRPRTDAPELNWDNVEIPGGRYLRDIRSSRNVDFATAQSEIVELAEADLRDVHCWLNVYRNTDSPVEGVVRVQTTSGAYDIPFSLTGKGDESAGRNRRDGNPAWLRIDVARALLP